MKMDNLRSITVGLVLAVILATPIVVSAQHDGPPADVTVQFGQFPPQALPPANRFLDPNDVTINTGGTVTFEFNGNGHAIAIYPVSKETVRTDIEEDLCQPSPILCDPMGTATSNLQYLVTDGKGNLVIDTGTNPPDLRIYYANNRLFYAGGPVTFTGRALPTSPAPQVQYRFKRPGRFLVICMNRNHFINDWMFGFVNVTGDHSDKAKDDK
jgi:hypothetical protein